MAVSGITNRQVQADWKRCAATSWGKVAGAVVIELLERIALISRKAGKTQPSTIQHIRPHVRTRSYFKSGRALAGKHGYYDEGSQDTGPDPL